MTFGEWDSVYDRSSSRVKTTHLGFGFYDKNTRLSTGHGLLGLGRRWGDAWDTNVSPVVDMKVFWPWMVVGWTAV